MPLGQQIPGTSSGPKGQRYRTAGAGTLRVFDAKNKDTYAAGVVPGTALPDGTALKDLPSFAANQQALGAVRGATVQTANGGIRVGGGTKRVQLSNDFILPSLAGIDGHYLILLGLRLASAAAPGSAQYLAGHATNTGSNCNWLAYQNNGNANINLQVGPVSPVNVGPPGDTGAHRYGLELIRDGAAGTIQVRVWKDAALIGTGNGAALASIPQPGVISPAVGAGGYGTGGLSIMSGDMDFNSAEIRNLLLDGSSITDTAVVASIIAEDYARWGARFG